MYTKTLAQRNKYQWSKVPCSRYYVYVRGAIGLGFFPLSTPILPC